jgi:histidinol phosphatase-like enzyme (inositol monophosphatase family)
MAELDSMLDFACNILHEAGRLTLGYFDRTLEVIDKSDGSPVTIADREAEAQLRAAISRRYPNHGIVGEEHGAKAPDPSTSYTWYIDPIDGTKSFIHGVPLYSNLLAVIRDGVPVIGLINIPAIGQLMHAAEGRGCFLNGRRVAVSSVATVERAICLTSSAEHLARHAPTPGWRSIWDRSKFNRTWGDGYGYLMVASGRGEVMFDGICQPYDIAPMPIILREAGGAFFNWQGTEDFTAGTGIATNAALRDTVRRAVMGGT